MSSKEYWEKRESEALKHYVSEEKEFNKQLQQIYADMLDEVQKEIDAFYGKYAKKEGISIAEAKKRVSQADIRAYERKAKRYVKEKDFSKEANEEMRLYNLTMKVNRLEMLKANIGLELIAGHNKLQKFMDKILRGRTEKELKRQAGILGKTVQDNAKAARVIVNASFHNATFSDRIWQYQDLMKNDLSKLLQTALIQGKNPRAVAGQLRKYWYGNDPRTGGGAEYCMERLMTTELARVQTEAQKESFKRNGFSQYTFHVNSGCCDICKALNGKHFNVDKMMPGENAPPMHPWCRCSTSAYEDEDEYEAWLDFLDKGGTTAEWNKLKEEELSRKKDGSHRKTGENGKQIIDTATYNKLTKKFLANGGIIIRGEEAAKHLGEKNAASYLPSLNSAFIRDDATISDVLEEMYHAEQDRTNKFGKVLTDEVRLKREIDAQNYLISMADRYKIPVEESELTKRNLKTYEDALKKLREEGEG